MNKFTKIIGGIAILALLVAGLFTLLQKEKVGAYNNQYDGVITSKVITSSDLTTSTPIAITEYATGDLYIDNVIVSTDSTGLATGTALEIKVENPTYGLSTFFSTVISGLGANKTIDLNTASVAKQHVVLRNGERLVANCTVANCEGAGKAKIDVIFKKVTQGANITE